MDNSHIVNTRPIGIVGGMGPRAGLELLRWITRHTRAASDQEHLTVYLLSDPASVADRSAFLLGESSDDPAPGLAANVQRLIDWGAKVIGIACNTAHAQPILGPSLERVAAAPGGVQLVSIVDAVVHALSSAVCAGATVGVLGTAGTIATDIYGKALARRGYQVRYLPETMIESLHAAIYDPSFGIKVRSDPATEQARAIVSTAIEELIQTGVAAVILGCTELPLALPAARFAVPVIDPARALAQALVERAAPGKWRDD